MYKIVKINLISVRIRRKKQRKQLILEFQPLNPPSSMPLAFPSDTFSPSWFTSSFATLLFKGRIVLFLSCPRHLHISNALIHGQFRTKLLRVKGKFVAYVVENICAIQL
jgi:hypothetical protein